MSQRLPGLILLAHLIFLQMLAPFAHCHGEALARPHVHLDSLPFLGHDHPHSDDSSDSDHDDDAVYLPDDPASLPRLTRLLADDFASWLITPPSASLTVTPLEPIALPPPFDERHGPPIYLRVCKLLI